MCHFVLFQRKLIDSRENELLPGHQFELLTDVSHDRAMTSLELPRFIYIAVRPFTFLNRGLTENTDYAVVIGKRKVTNDAESNKRCYVYMYTVFHEYTCSYFKQNI